MKIRFAAILALAVALGTLPLCRAADEPIDPATQARIAVFDKGPATVDVSHYPSAIQKDYKVFSMKCTVCHTLARPINSDFALPDEWSRYVKRMMFKPGSGIRPADAKKIYSFLVYDSSVRKKAALDVKLAQLPPADKAAAEEKIAALRQEVDGR